MNKDLIKDVEELISEVEKTHRYSMSRIYGLYNKVFETNESPQSCASCLIRKVNELKKWIENQNEDSSKDKDPLKSIIKDIPVVENTPQAEVKTKRGRKRR